jgi:alkylated DNA repair dioxygenase AlkB
MTNFMIRPGVFHLPRYLSLERQRDLARRCRALHDGEVPAYVPVVRGGGKMHVRMLCLGRHWNGKIYRYEPTRADFDDLPVPPIPEELRSLASDIARVVDMTLDPDVCILNHYGADGRLGLHQDKDESEATLAAGSAVCAAGIR